jgi:hypothetical protein
MVYSCRAPKEKRAREEREAESKARRDWRPAPFARKTPLVPLEEEYSTVRTTPQDDPFNITPNFNL